MYTVQELELRGLEHLCPAGGDHGEDGAGQPQHSHTAGK